MIIKKFKLFVTFSSKNALEMTVVLEKNPTMAAVPEWLPLTKFIFEQYYL